MPFFEVQEHTRKPKLLDSNPIDGSNIAFQLKENLSIELIVMSSILRRESESIERYSKPWTNSNRQVCVCVGVGVGFILHLNYHLQ